MTISFEAGTTIALGYPRSVAVADVNADGTADLVVLNGDTVDVLLGTGGGGFAAPIATSDFGDDVALDSLAVGDLNGDGLPDVAVSSEYGGVFVSFGNGSGGFGAPVTLVPNDYIGSLIVADLNGQTDLVGTTNGGVVVIPEDGQGNFGAPAFIAAGGSEDEQVVAADLTGNGLTDLVVVDDGYYSNGDVVVLLNDGSGGFAAPVTYAAGTNPDSVAVADVNGDGIPDLVVGDENSGGVEVLLGDGQGGFAAATNSDSDTFRSDVLLGDLSGDGTPDIASTAYFGYDNDENAVAVFPGDGSGGFDPPVIVPAGYDLNPIAVGDLNGDGLPDIVAEDYDNGDLVVLLNDSSFVGSVTTDPGFGPTGGFRVFGIGDTITITLALQQAVTVAGGVPKLTLNDGGAASYVSGSGTRTLVFSTTIAAGQQAPALAILGVALNGATVEEMSGAEADLSGAVGALAGDLIVSTSPALTGIAASPASGGTAEIGQTVTLTVATSGNVHLTPGNGGSLPGLTLSNGDVATYDAAASTATSLVFADPITSAAQGTPDLLVTGLQRNGAALIGPALFEPGTTYDATDQADAFTVADLTAGGPPDLVVLQQQQVDVLAGNGVGGFSDPAVTYLGTDLVAVAAADLLNDGTIDLVVTDETGGYNDGDVHVLMGNGSGGFSSEAQYADGTFPNTVAVADLRNDGIDDIVTDDADGGVSVLPGDGSGGFGTAVTYTAGDTPKGLVLADLANDGTIDAVVLDAGTSNNLPGIDVLPGDGSGGFGAPVDYALASEPSAVAVADLTGNGIPDIVATEYDGGVFVLLGDGSGGFGAAASYAAGPFPSNVTVADVNADGIPDLVVSNDDGVDVLYGNGSGGFLPPVDFPAGDGALSALVVDLNGDGAPDLVVDEYDSDGVVVMPNAGVVSALGVGALPGADTGVVVACFASGTRIGTSGGEVPVERLAAGDLVRTASGATEVVVWIGHRRTDCRRHPRPADVWPVRVDAGAFGDGLPRRDLFLSPDHAVFAADVLIPVKHLANGATIRQIEVETVTYWHVELSRHDVILAEGLPCESYLDTGNRGAFANGGGVVHAHPDFARKVWAESACAPLVEAGAARLAVADRLTRHAEELGWMLTSDPALVLEVDGRRVGLRRSGEWLVTALPPDAARAVLRSARAVPAPGLGHPDTRAMGVALTGLRLDGEDVGLDACYFMDGWHAPEDDFRWSDGAGEILLTGERRIGVRVAPWGRYWTPPYSAARSVAWGTS